MGILQSTAFKLGCKYYNWRNGTEESGSSDTQGLQNPEEGGSTSRIRHEEPLIPKIWQAEVGEQMILPFKPNRFREPPVKRLKYSGYYEPTFRNQKLGRFQNTWSSTADPNTVVCSSAANTY